MISSDLSEFFHNNVNKSAPSMIKKNIENYISSCQNMILKFNFLHWQFFLKFFTTTLTTFAKHVSFSLKKTIDGAANNKEYLLSCQNQPKLTEPATSARGQPSLGRNLLNKAFFVRVIINSAVAAAPPYFRGPLEILQNFRYGTVWGQ